MLRDRRLRHRNGQPVEERYDRDHRRLVYLWERSSPEGRGARWQNQGEELLLRRLVEARDTSVVGMIRRYLRPDAGPIL